MLNELRVRNYALIDELSISLGPGLNVLTGETGAGKSIVVGALALLLGERANAEAVRAGADRAYIEGVFDVGEDPAILAWLDALGIEAADGGLILRREVAIEGRNRAWINGTPATVALLGELGAGLVSFHGQHQHQKLLRRDEQRAILDAFGGHHEAASKVAELHHRLSDLSARLEQLQARRREALQREDYLRFQIAEIEEVAPAKGEEESLDEESRRLSHAEELLGLTAVLLESVGGDRHSASAQLGAVRRQLDQLIRIDPSQSGLAELFDTAYYSLEELTSRLSGYADLVEHDPERLQRVRQRQDRLYRLRSKYGPSIEDVLQTLEAARTELSTIGVAEGEIANLAEERERLRSDLGEAARSLTTARRGAAERLEMAVGELLPGLGMADGWVQVVLLPVSELSARGAEEVEFRIALNRGFDPKPLAQIASGGELSRVMLALKTILARLDDIPTLLFDEVDAGIGGRVAVQVGDRLHQVAQRHQVLAITHLPQIASRADKHLLVAKDDDDGRTRTTVKELAEGERVRELARMLGGDPESETSLAHARELLAKRWGVLPEPVG